MMREFSTTSQEGTVIKGFIKDGDPNFYYKIGDQTITLSFPQNEIFRNGTADLAEASLKNGK